MSHLSDDGAPQKCSIHKIPVDGHCESTTSITRLLHVHTSHSVLSIVLLTSEHCYPDDSI